MGLSGYYSAGTAALLVLLVVIGVGGYIWYRLRQRRILLSQKGDTEEHIPLQAAFEVDQLDSELAQRKGKGKERAMKADEGTPIFDVGEVDED